jgi:hypothetical protein
MESENKKYYCVAEGCFNEISQPKMCCNSFDCGCQGMPISPPFCSNECYDKYMRPTNQLNKQDETIP